MAEPLSISIFTYGTSEKTERELLDVVNKNFDLRPGVIVRYKCSCCSVEAASSPPRLTSAGAGVRKEDFPPPGRRGLPALTPAEHTPNAARLVLGLRGLEGPCWPADTDTGGWATFEQVGGSQEDNCKAEWLRAEWTSLVPSPLPLLPPCSEPGLVWMPGWAGWRSRENGAARPGFRP